MTLALTSIEQYAISMILDGAEAIIDDDLDEDGKLSDEDHSTATDLAYEIVGWIRENPHTLLRLIKGV